MKDVKIGVPLEYSDNENYIRRGLFLREKEVEALERRLEETNDLIKQVRKQQEVIDKAIEFINSIDLYSHEYALDSIEINDLLDILNGVSE